jgi:hypothetical protein
MSRALEVIDYGIKWAVGVVWGALIPHKNMRFVGDKI